MQKTGETYDAVGSGIPEEHFMKQWNSGVIQRRIEQHLTKAEYVPVDVTSSNMEQRNLVANFVDRLGNNHVFLVGE